MKKWAAFFLLFNFLILSGYGQWSSQKKIKIGLFRFSRAVFDQERKKMGKPYIDIENILVDKFNIKHNLYFENEEISFAEIEDPENFIDDSMTSDTIERLEKFCNQSSLDGIIFGHFEQESEMIIVFRLYFSRKAARIPGIRVIGKKNRIVSFRRNIPLDRLTPNMVNRVTDALTGMLDNLITGGTTTVTPAPAPSTPTPPMPTPLPREVTPLTIEDVYLMIKKHGFYFENNLRYVHQWALASLLTKGEIKRDRQLNYIFKYNRDIESSTVPGKPGIMKTISKNRENVTDVITLYWAKDQVKKIRYKDALEKIKELNEENYGGFSNWRIPTIKELFSIVDHLPHHDFFPFALDIEDMSDDPQSWEIKLWTSTPVTEDEKNYISDTCPSPDRAYFILENRRTQTEYNLTFHIGCEKYRLYVLPVRSGREDAIAPITSDKTVPESPLTVPPPPTQLETLFATQLSFINATPQRMKSMALKEIDIIWGTFSSILREELKEIQKKFGKKLIVNAQGHRISDSKESVESLLEIMYDEFMPIKNKIDRIIHTMMVPNKVDIIITGQYVFRPPNEKITIRPLVVFKSAKKILMKNILFNKNELVYRPRFGTRKLREGAKEIIREKVIEFLGQPYE